MSFDEDFKYYSEQIESGKASADDYFGRGECYNLIEDYDAARADFDEAIRRDSSNPHYFLTRAGNHLQQQNHVLSVADYTEAIRLADGNKKILDEAYLFRSGEYRWLGDFDAAIKDWNARMELTTDDRTHNLMHRAYLHRMNRDFPQAMKDAQEVLALDPSRSEATSFIAMCKAETGDLAGAEAGYTESGDLFHRATIRAKMGNIAGAEADFEEILRLNPNEDNTGVYFHRAENALKIGQFEAALHYANLLLQNNAEHFAFHLLRGDAYRGLGRTEEAAIDYHFVIKKLDDPIAKWDISKPAQADYLAEIYTSRGRAHAGLGNTQAATDDYRQLITLCERYSSLSLNRDMTPFKIYIEQHNPDTN